VTSPVITPALAPDDQIIGRDLLLDPQRAGAHLAALLDLPGTPVASLVRAKYRINENLRVSYRLDTAAGQVTVSGRTFPAGRSAAVYAKALAEAASSSGPLRRIPPVLHDPAHGAVWWVLPADRRLRQLAEVLEPRDVVRAALSLPGWTHTEVAEYSPERSLTVRASDRSGAVAGYVKAYAPGTADLAALRRRYDLVAGRLARTGRLRAPRVTAIAADRNLLVLEPMPGRGWGLLGDGEALEAIAALGSALGHLHTTPWQEAGAGLAPFGRLHPSRVRRSAELVAHARPDVAAAITALADDLLATQPAGDEAGDPVMLHGDCHPKNALFGQGALALIDLDQAGLGPAAADLGSLLARLASGTVLGERPAAIEPAMASAFLAAYAEIAPLPSQAVLRWHVAACLVAERAIRAVNRVQAQVLPRLPELISTARAVLDGDRWHGGRP
jgi:Ser/Thr protein kinase RdoA (MazF antagonist)